MSYRILFKLVLSRISPEAAHSLTAETFRLLGRLPGVRAALRRMLARRDPAIAVHAFGLTFPSPLGVPAGVDKNLTWFEELGALGFGFVEVGTVTAHAQPGNPQPRVHRLPADRALINSMGFPNRGAGAAAQRLRARTGHTIVAVNIGKSRAATDANGDYRASVRELGALADMLVLNVSSPNTPGLRAMQAGDALRALVTTVRDELDRLGVRVPLLVKIAPDLDDDALDAIAATALELGLDGIVAVNTTTARDGLVSSPELSAQPGGLSGAPLRARAVEVLRRLHARTAGQLVLVSVGGLETADDAFERIRAGATLVQAYTGFVYGGPLWPSRINRGLARRVREAGASSLDELIGAAGRSSEPATPVATASRDAGA